MHYVSLCYVCTIFIIFKIIFFTSYLQRRREEIRKKLAKRNVESLEMPQHKVASDYYTEEEVVQFKKPKKKKKVKRKMLKADDLLALNNDVNTEQSRIKKEYSRGMYVKMFNFVACMQVAVIIYYINQFFYTRCTKRQLTSM